MSTRSLILTRPETSVGSLPSLADESNAAIDNQRNMQLTKSVYQADQQEKFLHLQAEVESLLQHLQTLQQQKVEPIDKEIEQVKQIEER
jgi:hypothetical protein